MSHSYMGFHQGAALLGLARTYPSLVEVLLEAIQNSIDKNATQISVIVNQRKRKVFLRDNGDGVSGEEFERALSQIGKTMKRTDKLGRFGRGLIAPIGKCELYTFTSAAKGKNEKYSRWTFVTRELENEDKQLSIPRETLPLMFVAKKQGFTGNQVGWRTEVCLEDYTKDRFLSQISLEALKEGVLEKYSVAMLKNRVVVSVDITPEDDGPHQIAEIRATAFTGLPLPEVTFEDSDAGATYFRLFVTKRTAKGYTGKIHVGEKGNDFRISWSMFARSLPQGCHLEDDTLAAMNSGLFEGEILTSKARFHANRRSFEQNDALAGFGSTIDDWYKKIGAQHYKTARDTKQDERYQRIGQASLRVIEGLLKSPEGTRFMEVIEKCKRGTIGVGHVEKPGTESDQPGIGTGRGGRKTGSTDEKSSGGKPDRDGRRPELERPNHHPFVALGPQGKVRTSVRSNSLGIMLEHEAMDSERLWVFDPTVGLLRINVSHTLYASCEERGDKVLGRFEEWIILQALECFSVPEEHRDVVKSAFTEMNSSYVFFLLNGDRLAGRIPTPKTKLRLVEGSKK
jgi:Histidine kinase-, DNA gyrase B-, and HSP90-like ATPase